MTKSFYLLSLASLLLGLGLLMSCDETKKLTEADPSVPCGRFCNQCSECKDDPSQDDYVQQLINLTCTFEQVGMACQLACDNVSYLKEQVEHSEEVTGKKVDEMTCEEFAKSLSGPDETKVCGRYCVKCDSCRGASDSYMQSLLDLSCKDVGVGVACEESCEANTTLEDKATAAETGTEKPLTELSCEEFTLAVATGVTDGPCLRFCAKCVECSDDVSSDAAKWCAKENGVPCVTACESGFKSYVTTFEQTAAENTEGIDDLSDISCTDYEATYDKVGLETPTLP